MVGSCPLYVQSVTIDSYFRHVLSVIKGLILFVCAVGTWTHTNEYYRYVQSVTIDVRISEAVATYTYVRYEKNNIILRTSCAFVLVCRLQYAGQMPQCLWHGIGLYVYALTCVWISALKQSLCPVPFCWESDTKQTLMLIHTAGSTGVIHRDVCSCPGSGAWLISQGHQFIGSQKVLMCVVCWGIRHRLQYPSGPPYRMERTSGNTFGCIE
jgi:hypothetical protein